MNERINKIRNIMKLSAFIIVLLALPGSLVFASSSISHDAGVGIDLEGVGTMDWKKPNNITSPDSPYAFTNPLPNNGGTTHYLRGTNYGFAIPTDATINGIVVEIRRNTNDKKYPTVRDNIVRLVKDGVIIGDNKAATDTDWPTVFMTARYGGVSDLWGVTWSAADINSPNFGVVLSIVNPNATSFGKGTIDWMRITVYYNMVESTTTVDCGEGTPDVIYGDSITCIVTVARSSGIDTPSGSVDWATDSSGSFDPSSCVLSGSYGTATCSVSYTPGEVGTGIHRITAAYNNDLNFSESDNYNDVEVFKAIPTLSVTNSPITFDGLKHTANLEGSVPGMVSNIRYAGSATEPIDAGMYAIMADFTPTDTSNYEALTDADAGDFVIEKASPELSVTNSPTKFNGSSQSVNVQGSIMGIASNIRYNGSATEPILPGVYPITADFSPTDVVNYKYLTDAYVGEFVIQGQSVYLPVILK